MNSLKTIERVMKVLIWNFKFTSVNYEQSLPFECSRWGVLTITKIIIELNFRYLFNTDLSLVLAKIWIKAF